MRHGDTAADPGQKRDMGTSPFGFSHLRLARMRESIKLSLYLLVRGMSLQMRCLQVTTQSAGCVSPCPVCPGSDYW
jgi:hypothetical protein